MLFVKKETVHPEKSFIFRFASKHLRVTHDYKGEHFFVRTGGKLYATPADGNPLSYEALASLPEK